MISRLSSESVQNSEKKVGDAYAGALTAKGFKMQAPTKPNYPEAKR
jgi:hypothetical protein